MQTGGVNADICIPIEENGMPLPYIINLTIDSAQ